MGLTDHLARDHRPGRPAREHRARSRRAPPRLRRVLPVVAEGLAGIRDFIAARLNVVAVHRLKTSCVLRGDARCARLSLRGMASWAPARPNCKPVTKIRRASPRMGRRRRPD